MNRKSIFQNKHNNNDRVKCVMWSKKYLFRWFWENSSHLQNNKIGFLLDIMHKN